jgi:4-hydroxybenzoate polyprenyltransferase
MYQSFLLALNRVHPRTWDFVQLMRLEKPIGIYLLLWPTLWALWVASKGVPDFKWLLIFVLGTLFMRAAGCVINDYADRHFDGHVARTRARPLADGRVTPREALMDKVYYINAEINYKRTEFGLPLHQTEDTTKEE